MGFTFSIEHFGAFHGIILAFVLATRKQNRLANGMLAVSISLLSILLVDMYMLRSGMLLKYPHFIYICMPVYLLIWPFFYFYISLFIGRIQRFEKKYLLHFIPFIISLLIMLPFYFHSEDYKIAYYQHVQENGMTTVLKFSYILRSIQAWGYCVALIVILKTYRSKLRDYFAETYRLNLNWLRLFMIFYLLMLIMGTSRLFARFYNLDLPVLYDTVTRLIISFGTTFWIYIVGYFAIMQPEMKKLTHHMYDDIHKDVQPLDTEISENKEKYINSKIEAYEAQTYIRELERLMKEEKMYLNKDLSLQDLADKLGLSAHNLSQLINTYLNQNFYNFINSYRVKEMAKLLRQGYNNEKSILEIAYNAGFRSKSTFNAMFKKYMGETPSTFRKKAFSE